jgi:hypothetical protein
MDNTNVFQYIKGLPEDAVYWVTGKDYTYINITSNLKSKIGEIAELVDGDGKFEYLEVPAHPVYKLIMAERVRQRILKEGGRVEGAPFIKFKCHIVMDVLARGVFVYYRTARGQKEVVGYLDSFKEAEEYKQWLEEHDYPVVCSVSARMRKFCRMPVYKQNMTVKMSPKVESNVSEAANEVSSDADR